MLQARRSRVRDLTSFFISTFVSLAIQSLQLGLTTSLFSNLDSTRELNFSIYLILPATLGPGVYSASNRNKYQK
jgi:hypothetical protein